MWQELSSCHRKERNEFGGMGFWDVMCKLSPTGGTPSMVTPCCVWGIHLEVPSSLQGFSCPPWALSKAAAACGVGRRQLQWWGRWRCRQFDPESCISLNLQL